MSVGLFQYDPLTFMKNNIVITPGAIPGGPPTAMTLRASGHQGQHPDGTAVTVFDLAVPAPNDRTFDAYWCPYLPNQLQSVQLSNQADYMFTATMDGCSLGVGPRNGNGDVLVSHVNSMDFGGDVVDKVESVGRWLPRGPRRSLSHSVGRFFQGMSQSFRLHRTHGIKVKVLSPGDYRVNPHSGQHELQSTTFGLRDRGTNRWKFYVQLRWPYGLGHYILIDVRQVT